MSGGSFVVAGAPTHAIVDQALGFAEQAARQPMALRNGERRQLELADANVSERIDVRRTVEAALAGIGAQLAVVLGQRLFVKAGRRQIELVRLGRAANGKHDRIKLFALHQR